MSDSKFVFNQKLKGKGKRVAVASMLDYSASMNGTTLQGLPAFEGLQKTLSRYGLAKEASELLAWITEWKAALDDSRAKHPDFVASNTAKDCIKIYVARDGIRHCFGNPASFSDRKGGNFKNSPTCSLSFSFVCNFSLHQRLSFKISADEHGELMVMRFAALFQRTQGQWIGANLIREAFTKCGIPQWWGAFHDKAYTLKSWGEAGALTCPVKDLGSTNTALAIANCVNALKARREERKIAVIFSDGDLDVSYCESTDGVAPLACDRMDADYDGSATFSTTQVIKRAWKEGIEIYYVGLQLNSRQIKRAESMVGKGHAVSVVDVASELPKVLEQIISLNEHDTRSTQDGQGFKIKR